MKKNVWFFLMIFVVLSVAQVKAQASNWYIGGGLGATELESDVVLLTVLFPDHLEMEERGIGFKVFGGYKLNDFFSFELSYTDFPEWEVTANSGAIITSEDVIWKFTQDGSHIEVAYSTISFGVVASLPLKIVTRKKIFNRLVTHGKLGVHYWTVDKSVPAGLVDYYLMQDPILPNPSTPTTHNPQNESGLGWFYGVGISYTVNEQLSLGLDWEWHSIDEGMIKDSDFIFLNVVYHF